AVLDEHRQREVLLDLVARHAPQQVLGQLRACRVDEGQPGRLGDAAPDRRLLGEAERDDGALERLAAADAEGLGLLEVLGAERAGLAQAGFEPGASRAQRTNPLN